MLSLNFTPFPTIETERLVLRKAEMTDDKETLLIRSNERVNKYLDRPKAVSIEDARKFLHKLIDGIDKNECVAWAINLKHTPLLIGSVCLWNISPEYEAAELGFELLPHHWGKGIMKEALFPVIAYAFGTMKLKKIEAWTHTDNYPSQKLMEKNNFSRDFELEGKMTGKDVFQNMLIYSLRNDQLVKNA